MSSAGVWGGIEAEAVMLGQPYYMSIPEVIGVKMTGSLGPGITATDLVLTITERLRKLNVVEKFVEFFGPGMERLNVPDRATVANMAPEYGATIGFFPVDKKNSRISEYNKPGRTSGNYGVLYKNDGSVLYGEGKPGIYKGY